MSYDISFRVRVADTSHYIEACECSASISWECRDLIVRSTGLEWKNEENNGFCVDIIPKIQQGISELIQNPGKYREFSRKNGYDIEHTIYFFHTIVNEWNNYATHEDAEVVAQTTFWII